jgi:hypothetical protein
LRLAILASLIASCGGSPPGPPPNYPGVLAAPSSLQSPSALGESFALDQNVRTESSQGAHEFRAVLQRRGDELLLVGLGPQGMRGFVLTQRGEDVSFESHLPQELPFPPRFMLLDIHRTWFRGLPQPQEDGEHRIEVDGEEIVERWQGGRLQERTFRRLDGAPPGLITVSYEGGLGGETPPRVVHFDNGWFGYRLTLTTLDHQRIEETAGGEESGEESSEAEP